MTALPYDNPASGNCRKVRLLIAPEGGFDLEPYPAVRKWLERVEARPGVVRI